MRIVLEGMEEKVRMKGNESGVQPQPQARPSPIEVSLTGGASLGNVPRAGYPGWLAESERF